MEFGDILLAVGLFTAVAGAVLMLGSSRDRRLMPIANGVFGLHVLSLVTAFAVLAVLFVGRHYEYSYVAQYSSRALSPAMAFAATWAGQEGSFLLWAVFAALIGIALLRQPGQLTRPAMAFLLMTQAFLMVLLVYRSPFLRAAIAAPDGQGLNPLLEDPWMIIHPPVLFAGYAALTVPFALACAYLLRPGDGREWNRMAWPWSLFGVVSLGAGIALGGVWAYKVLGWGGYWGWDPVENASLVPWLVVVALLHGLLIQRTTGALPRTNLALAALGWVTVLGGTYLTRSGILQDFSVHSFTDLGLNAPLMAFLASNALLAVALLVWRWRAVGAVPRPWITVSRESSLWIGLATVLILAALVAVGTLAPVLTALAGGKPANVSTEYYKLITVPLGIAIVLLMALAPVLTWSRQRGTAWRAALIPGVVSGVLLPLAAVMAGVRDVVTLALLLVSGLALGVNAGVAIRLFRRGWTYGSGYLVHAGIAIMVLGMMVSSALGTSQRLRLVQGRPAEALGYRLEFRGMEEVKPREHVLHVMVSKGEWSLHAQPMLVLMQRQEGMVRKPAIDGWRDFYLSPMEYVPGSATGGNEPVWLTKQQPVQVGEATVRFIGFRMESHEGMRLYADLDVMRDGRIERVSPMMQATEQGNTPQSVSVPGLGPIVLAHVDADGGRVGLLFPELAATPAIAVVELSTKPFVNLVWIGALVALIGSAIAGLRRAVEWLPGRVARPAPART